MEDSPAVIYKKQQIKRLKKLSRRKGLVMAGKTAGYIALHGLLGTLAGAIAIKVGNPDAVKPLAVVAFWTSAFSNLFINPSRSIIRFASARTLLHNDRQKLSKLMGKKFKPQATSEGLKTTIFSAAMVAAILSAGAGTLLGSPLVQKIIPWAAPKTQETPKKETPQAQTSLLYHSNIPSFS